MKDVLILPYPPSTNRYWRHTVNRSGQPVIYLTQDGKEYKTIVGWMALKSGYTQPYAEEVILYLDVYRPRQVGDLDNRIKILMDALQGFCYENDSQVVEIHARRFEDKTDPRAEVRVTPAHLDPLPAHIEKAVREAGWMPGGIAKDLG